MVEPIVVLFLWLYLLIQIILLIYIFTDEFGKTALLRIAANQPEISILIAARNEEQHIASCLDSILALNYPIDKIEILIGNDQSTDATENILKQYATTHPQIKYFNIQQTIGNAKAKANVLAQLIHKTNNEFLFVTDADIKVNSNWVTELLPFLTDKNIDLVSGTTIASGESYFSRMQGLDWLLASGFIIGFDRFGIKTSAVGNNMAFTKTAYFKTGGYENLPYSVTEDFQLYKHILKQGGKCINLLNTHCINNSYAINTFTEFLHQRKRWLIGAQGLGIKFKLIMLVAAMFLPLVVYLLFTNLFLGVLIWTVKVLLQTITLLLLHFRLKIKPKILDILGFEFYLNTSTIASLIFYILPIKMIWKSR